MIFKILVFFCTLNSSLSFAETNYHSIGWSNALIPGSGQMWLGNYSLGAFQATYEIGSFWYGFHLSKSEVFSLDGFTSSRPEDKTAPRGGVDYKEQLYGDILQELGLKTHMINTFDVYRESAKRNGALPDDIDDHTIGELFAEPFHTSNFENPWVYIPLGATFLYTVTDFISQTSNERVRSTRYTPGSNALYAFNFGFWQPTGSGAPEEMFYRGFLQNEFMHMTNSPLASIAMSTTLFAFSHEPGPGRYSAAVAGSYLGYLAYKYHGKLGPGITVHFWSGLLLGIETVLLSHSEQRNTPPATLDFQINF